MVQQESAASTASRAQVVVCHFEARCPQVGGADAGGNDKPRTKGISAGLPWRIMCLEQAQAGC
jgi:hypothetical protein